MTSIEKFHWLDQNSDYPNYVFARLRFAAPLDPELARQALDVALKRQPLAYKRPEQRGRRWCWGDNANDTKYFDFKKFDFEPSWEFDKAEPFVAYRLSLVEFPSDGELVAEARFCSHHAASDGVASIKLINDWLTIYNNLVAGQEPQENLHAVDQTKIGQRGRLGLTRWSYLRHLPNQLIALFGAAKFIFRKTARLSTRKAVEAAESEPTFPAIVGRWVEQEDYDRSKAIAGEFGVSYTSVCLAACFQAIDRWNQELAGENTSRRRQPWRILLPMSIRGRHDRTLPATNQTAIVQIDRCPPDEPERDSFCQGIDREVGIIRGWQLEKMFLIAIRCASISNRWLGKIANNPDSRGAAVFTHLGQPYKRAFILAGRLAKVFPELSHKFAKPIDFDLAGPVRSGTPINFSFARHERRLKITLHFDHTVISQTDADRLLDVTVELLNAR